MAIPESQLETWAKQGSVTQSKETYATIKRCLEAVDTPFASRAFKIFLQGSYGNDTNIYAESDVDVVIQLDSTFYYDTTKLPHEDLAQFNRSLLAASYSYDEFKRDVIATLRARLGADVTVGTKAISIAANGNRRKVDVLVAAQFRTYQRFDPYTSGHYVEGICFWTTSGERVVNYPKQHSMNCTQKHQRTREWYKPTVRILKNLRSYMVDRGAISRGLAPSYLLEGLIYNVPTERFGFSYQTTISSTLDWIHRSDRPTLLCANEQFYLLRHGSTNCWAPTDFELFLSAAIRAWNDWSK